MTVFRYFLFFVIIVTLVSACTKSDPKVYMIPSLHRLHAANPNYSYGDLRQLVTALKPDVIAVEIRASDMDADSLYLAKNYPYEMRMMRFWFPKSKIVGFDWLGEDIENQRIPDNYWSEIAPIKRWERELNEDSIFAEKLEACRELSRERVSIIRNASLEDILHSDNGRLTNEFYHCLEHVVSGSRHEMIPNFYRERDERIKENIEKIIAENPGRKIVIITGDDHYIYLKDKIEHQDLFPKSKD